jgi:LacI family transcriptional regulator
VIFLLLLLISFILIYIESDVNFLEPNSLDKALCLVIHLIILDRRVPDVDCLSVLADNFRGGYMATEHLINLGHRRIGSIARPVRLSHSQDRILGYQAALHDYGLPVDEALVAKGGFRLENGREATFYLLQLGPPPTAIFAYNDIMAIGALRVAVTT